MVIRNTDCSYDAYPFRTKIVEEKEHIKDKTITQIVNEKYLLILYCLLSRILYLQRRAFYKESMFPLTLLGINKYFKIVLFFTGSKEKKQQNMS